MAGYRVYLLNERHRIEMGLPFDASDDDEAITIADALFGAVADRFGGYEIWQCARLLTATAPHLAGPPVPANLTDAGKLQLLALADALKHTSPSLRSSRQLTQAVD